MDRSSNGPRQRWMPAVAAVVGLVLLASACTSVRQIDAGPAEAGPSFAPSPAPSASIFVPTSPVPRVPSPAFGAPAAPLPDTSVPLPTTAASPVPSSDTGVIEEGSSGVVPCGREERETISGVDVVTKWTCYSITGKTMSALVRQTRKAGPKVDGSRAVAAAQWKLGWSYTTVDNPGGCDLTGPNVKADITYIYPRVTNDEPAATITAWEEFMREVVIPHEETHGTITLNGAKRIVGVLGRSKAAKTCEKLRKSADGAARSVADDTEAKQNAFDEKEKHR